MQKKRCAIPPRETAVKRKRTVKSASRPHLARSRSSWQSALSRSNLGGICSQAESAGTKSAPARFAGVWHTIGTHRAPRWSFDTLEDLINFFGFIGVEWSHLPALNRRGNFGRVESV